MLSGGSPAPFLDMKLVVASLGVAAGTTLVTLTTIDMTSGGHFDTITLVVQFGTIVDGSVIQINAYSCSDAGGTSPVLINTISSAPGQTTPFTAATSSNGFAWLTVIRPPTPYIQFTISRTTQNATILGAMAYLSHPRLEPVVHPETGNLAYAVGLAN